VVDLGERHVNGRSPREYLGHGDYFHGCRWSRCRRGRGERRGRGGSAIGTTCRGAPYPRPENTCCGATAGSRPATEDEDDDKADDDVEDTERWRRLVRQLHSGEGGRCCAAVPRAARLRQQTGQGRRRRRLRALAAPVPAVVACLSARLLSARTAGVLCRSKGFGPDLGHVETTVDDSFVQRLPVPHSQPFEHDGSFGQPRPLRDRFAKRAAQRTIRRSCPTRTSQRDDHGRRRCIARA
jgi:hypothetical protein